MTLAIFDLDNTLLAGDSDHLWGEFLCAKGLVDAGSFRAQNELYYQQYQRGALDIHAYLAFSLAPLRGRTPASLAPLQAEFIDNHIKPLMLPAAARLLETHRERGERLLIITATNEFVTRPIASLLGVDDLLGCQVEVLDGALTGSAFGTLTYREGKVARLQEWLLEQREQLAGASFYSDSHNDLPLLELVDTPVAVDADEQLSAIAAERGWRQISLRG
ncbi:MAG: HAD family hydrolase [Congregibacter sp.]